MDMARRVVIPEIASFLRMIKFPTKVDLLGSIVVRRCWGEEACDWYDCDDWSWDDEIDEIIERFALDDEMCLKDHPGLAESDHRTSVLRSTPL